LNLVVFLLTFIGTFTSAESITKNPTPINLKNSKLRSRTVDYAYFWYSFIHNNASFRERLNLTSQVPPCDKWVPVNTVRRALKLWMEERPPIWRVDANILNKQPWTADKRWSSRLGVGRCANSSPQNKNVQCYEMFMQKASDLD